VAAGQDREGEWMFHADQAAQWTAVQVPHTWQVMPGLAGHRGVAWYQREVDIPAAWAGSTIRIEFEAVFHSAWVSVNGQPAGEHTGKGYTTFCLDITHLLRFGGRNTIAVKVDNSFDERILPRGRSNSVYTADKLMVAAAGCRVPTLWRRLTPGTLKCRSVDLKLPALPESERIVRAARLYREALGLIETRPDSAYHLLISVAETLSNLVVNQLERDLGKMNLQLIANEENQDRAQCGKNEASRMIPLVCWARKHVGNTATDDRSDDAEHDRPEDRYVHVHHRSRDNP
jgi:hypothetical protein